MRNLINTNQRIQDDSKENYGPKTDFNLSNQQVKRVKPIKKISIKKLSKSSKNLEAVKLKQTKPRSSLEILHIKKTQK